MHEATAFRICPGCGHRGLERRCPADGYPTLPEARLDPGSQVPRLVGRVLDERWQVLALLGSGATGWVFRARHVSSDQPVALKVLRKGPADELRAIRRFYQEARATARFAHPNTVRILDFGASDDGFLYLAMELLEGRSLAQTLAAGGPLAPQDAVSVARQVAGALAEAHGKGVVHRDLKPDNLFLTQVGGASDFVKVLDFGTAKLLEGGDIGAEVTLTGWIVGSPSYMAPEQVQCQAIDGRADLYALGMVLIEMLLGAAPFTGAVEEVLRQQLFALPPPLPTSIDGRPVPETLRRLVHDLVAKRPEDRPPDAATVEQRLVAIAAELSLDASGAAPLPRPPSASNLPTRPPSQATRSYTGPVSWPSLDAEPQRVPHARHAVAFGLAAAALVGLLVAWQLPSAPATLAPRPAAAAVPSAASALRTSPAPRFTRAPPEAARTARLTSTPEGAAVYDGGVRLGVTPLEVPLAPRAPRVLRLALSGHTDARLSLAPDDAGPRHVELVPVRPAAAAPAPRPPGPRKASPPRPEGAAPAEPKKHYDIHYF